MTRRPVSHTLKVKCPTWDHVESFYRKKVKPGGRLSARVPFQPAAGEVVTIALELPDELIVAIEGEVESVAPAPDGKKSAVALTLYGLTDRVLERLEALVAEARRKKGEGAGAQAPAAARPAWASSRPPVPLPWGGPGATSIEDGATPPPPLPTDAPVDEVVEQFEVPRAELVPEDERPVFTQLAGELRRLREASAADILGVRWDAGVEAIRTAHFSLTRRLHPDAFAHHRSRAIQTIATELFIHVNRAYDRMRDEAVAAGAAIAAGPALLPHRGFMARFDDFGSGRITPPGGMPSRPEGGPPSAGSTPTPVPFTAEHLFADVQDSDTHRAAIQVQPDVGITGALAPPTTPPSDAFDEPVADLEARGRASLEAGDFAAARETLAAVLRRDPRNRTVRALYHTASAEVLLVEDKPVEARTQLEVALAHDPGCERAERVIERMRRAQLKKTGSFKRGRFR